MQPKGRSSGESEEGKLGSSRTLDAHFHDLTKNRISFASLLRLRGARRTGPSALWPCVYVVVYHFRRGFVPICRVLPPFSDAVLRYGASGRVSCPFGPRPPVPRSIPCRGLAHAREPPRPAVQGWQGVGGRPRRYCGMVGGGCRPSTGIDRRQPAQPAGSAGVTGLGRPHTHPPAERLGLTLWPAQASMRAVQPFR